jgi:hypothetical protein
VKILLESESGEASQSNNPVPTVAIPGPNISRARPNRLGIRASRTSDLGLRISGPTGQDGRKDRPVPAKQGHGDVVNSEEPKGLEADRPLERINDH